MERDGARREELGRVVVGHRLHVLRQRERHGAAERGVGQHAQRARQRGEQLGRMHDPVEVARHGLERVVRRDRAVMEILDLLQHRVRRARHEHVARQQQHRQPVHVRERGRGDEVRRAGADRCRHGHHPAAQVRLRVRDRAVRHRLLVVRAVGRQRVAVLMQRLAQARDVAVPEDREHAAEQRRVAVAGHDALRGQIAHERLRGGQPDRALHARGRIVDEVVHARAPSGVVIHCSAIHRAAPRRPRAARRRRGGRARGRPCGPRATRRSASRKCAARARSARHRRSRPRARRGSVRGRSCGPP
ncbi:hypothetical protein NCH_04217 [Burkholderia pseudomallei]